MRRMIPDLISALIPNLIAAAIWSALATAARAFRKWPSTRRTTVNVIHKVPLHLDQSNTVDAAQVLRVGEQSGQLFVWVRRSDEEASLRYTLAVRGTGQVYPDHWVYLGAAQIGPYVWHVLQCGAPRLTPPR